MLVAYPLEMRVVALLLAAALVQQSDPQAIQRMAATDRAYASAALDVGRRDAALAFTLDTAVAISEETGTVTLVPARPVMAARPLEKLPLGLREIWEPFTGQVSADGSFGWTTGARASLTQPIATIPSQGAYLRIWIRQADGAWRVWLEDEVRFPDTWRDAAPFRVAPDPDAGTAGTQGESLTDAEASVGTGGTSWTARLAATARVHRAGVGPMMDRPSILAWAATAWAGATFHVLADRRADSDDLGVTVGRYELAHAARSERG